MVEGKGGRRGEVRIGTSGWHYRHWRGLFYPEQLPAASMLVFYAQRFDCVELNNSFYRLPSAETFRAWAATVPSDFRFAVKGSRYITHVKKLRDPQQPIERLTGVAGALGEKLGPMLFQLPPHWRRDLDRLRAFLEAWPGDWPSVWEFRDASWLRQDTYDLLEEHGAGLCISDMPGAQTPPLATAAHVYVRLHGSGGAYTGSYSHEALLGWAVRARTWVQAGHAVWCFFNNDQHGHAVADAERLRALVVEDSGYTEP